MLGGYNILNDMQRFANRRRHKALSKGAGLWLTVPEFKWHPTNKKNGPRPSASYRGARRNASRYFRAEFLNAKRGFTSNALD